MQAQTKVREIIVEEYDSKGNLIVRDKKPAADKKKIEVVTSKKDGVTTKEINLGPVINRPFSPDTIDKSKITIQVYKQFGRVYVYHKDNFLTAYRCVFGTNPQGQKLCEGDKKTPEGWFTITNIRPHDKWTMFMDFDYPNAESYKNFEEAKKNGTIPQSARIGGLVGIHGIWNGGDDAVKRKFNWTDGCVSLCNSDVKELSKIVQPGTRIYIGWSK